LNGPTLLKGRKRNRSFLRKHDIGDQSNGYRWVEITKDDVLNDVYSFVGVAAESIDFGVIGSLFFHGKDLSGF
jgi:hypothetical protein